MSTRSTKQPEPSAPVGTGDRPGWRPDSWTEHPAGQQPDWPDPGVYDGVVAELGRRPPLVFAGEARRLTDHLAGVAAGRAFVLQAGDCAESFHLSTADTIRDRLKVVLQMAAVLQYSAGMPIVKVGRIAGQFAKPRSADTETRDGETLPVFRGHIVNDIAFDAAARRPDPARLLEAYNTSAATLNLLRAFTRGGYADLNQIHTWTQEFVASSPAGRRYAGVADGIAAALRFMASCGMDVDSPAMRQVELYTSHEALLLGYEQALTRRDSITGDWYDCSAHMLWVGERTRELDGAHVEFVRGVHNPIAVKLGPTATPAEALELCAALNPDAVPGRLTLVSRMGAESVGDRLAPLVRAVADAGHPVVWQCDPMHGNTYSTGDGVKTRHFDAITAEVRGYFDVHRAEGTWPGGVHLEITGDPVTECIGGADDLGVEQLGDRYETMCDPRLNARQSLDMAFAVAELLAG
ncbi:MAG TPA: 3-deoxy-7-phosphoheptulonate synthase class II [Acidimicrobiaceae bacterium]|nr:3-deoxy-7-phosphoheptulonate synthase class II [Acidimicrobiaceae bacterium]HCB37462.1 3-deoxy-7-phosphoheptulonate synthase class II [Acidimicrobiaceae bacterium]